MSRAKGFSEFINEAERDTSNYMFFSNLERIQELASMLLEMDQNTIDQMLNNGHDWADDHISRAKENLDHVFEFFKGELSENITELAKKSITKRLDESEEFIFELSKAEQYFWALHADLYDKLNNSGNQDKTYKELSLSIHDKRRKDALNYFHALIKSKK